jgi:D-aminopeptidase
VSERRLQVDFDEQKIDAIFAQLNQCHLPGAAVGIAIAGKPVYRKGFGLASMELPVVLAPSTRMRIGSTSKHFACLAFMLLCEEGRAALDDPLKKYLPELHPVTHAVTMRQLMGHISGLRDARDVRCQLNGTDRIVSTDETVSLYRDIDDVNFAPGTNYSYNNGGILLLGAVIERITEKPLSEVLRTRILEPVGMYDSLLRKHDNDFVPNSAALHAPHPTGDFRDATIGGEVAGDGGIVSTVNDMLRWLAHMDAPVVGSAKSWSLMRTPQTLVNGTSTGYGFGLKTQRYRGADILYHAGSVMGGNAQMLKVPQARLDLAIMVNRSDVMSWSLADRILDTCLPGLTPIQAPPERPFATGTFRSRATGRVIHLFERKGQQTVSFEGLDLAFPHATDSMLKAAGISSFDQIAITLVGDPHAPEAVALNQFGNRDELERIPLEAKPDLNAICGRWKSDATATEAIVQSDDSGAPTLRTTGRFGSVEFNMQHLAGAIWKLTAPGPGRAGVLTVNPNKQSLLFSTYRTWGLKFRRIS